MSRSRQNNPKSCSASMSTLLFELLFTSGKHTYPSQFFHNIKRTSILWILTVWSEKKNNVCTSYTKTNEFIFSIQTCKSCLLHMYLSKFYCLKQTRWLYLMEIKVLKNAIFYQSKLEWRWVFVAYECQEKVYSISMWWLHF